MVVLVCKDTLQSIQPTLSCPKFCFEDFAPDGNTVNASARLFLLALGDNKYAFCRVEGTHKLGRDYFQSTSLVVIGYNEIETYVLFFFSDMQINMRVYQESSEQSEDDSIEI